MDQSWLACDAAADRRRAWRCRRSPRRGERFELILDLCAHAIVLRTSKGVRDSLPLQPTKHRRASPRFRRHARPPRPAVELQRPPQLKSRCRAASPRTSAPRHYDPDSAERLRDALARIVPVFEHFAPGSPARRARFSSSGAASTLPLPASRAAPRRSIRAAFPACLTGSPAKPIAMKIERRLLAGRGHRPTAIFYSYAYPEPDGFRGSVSHAGPRSGSTNAR